MRRDDGEETKGGMAKDEQRQTVLKPNALNIYDNMHQGWQIRSEWPELDTLLQSMVPPPPEHAGVIHATIKVALNRIQERADDPAIFLVYRDWARALPPQLLDHKDAQVIAATFCSCIRGLWKQREHKLMTQLTTILKETMINNGGADSWNQSTENITGLLTQTLDDATRQYQQHYGDATGNMPQVYQTIIRMEYRDKDDAAFYKIQGKIALFRKMQVQTPTKAAQKELTKTSPNISFVNEIPQMFAGGVDFPGRTAVPTMTQEDRQADHNYFTQYRTCSTTAPTFEQASQQQILETVSQIALSADESFGRSQCVLLVGLQQWTTEETTAQNTEKTEAMIQHIIGRLGYQNESPHFEPGFFNGMVPILNKPGYEYNLERDDSKMGMMMVELESPAIFGSVSTLVADIDNPGIVGEIQRMYLRPEYSPYRKAARTLIHAQMMPYIRLDELRQDETTPLIGCIKGLPSGANANTLSGACFHAVRKWLNEAMHFATDKYTLLLDATWRNPPKQGKGQQANQRSAVLLPFIKIIFTGNSGRLTGCNDDEFRQYQEALLARKPNWLIHVGGFRLEFCCTIKELRDSNNHQWIQGKTPCAIIKPIRAGLMARDILHCLFDRAWGNRAALHNIRGIHILPRAGFGNDPGDMKYYDEACVVIFLNEAFTLDITSILQRFAGKDIKTTKIEDVPGRTQLVEAGSWFTIFPNGGSDITLGDAEVTPVYQTPEDTRFNGGMQSSRTTRHVAPTATDTSMMEIDTGGLGASRRSEQIKPSEITQYDKLNSVISRLLMDHEALHISQISTTMALEDLGKQLHESQRRHHADMQEIQEGHVRDILELKQHQEEMVRTEISSAFQQMSFRAEFTQRLLHLESTLRDIHDKYDTAKENHQQAILELGALGPGTPKSTEAAAQRDTDRLGRLLSKQEASLDNARSDYETYAISGGVDPSPLLSRYVRQ